MDAFLHGDDPELIFLVDLDEKDPLLVIIHELLVNAGQVGRGRGTLGKLMKPSHHSKLPFENPAKIIIIIIHQTIMIITILHPCSLCVFMYCKRAEMMTGLVLKSTLRISPWSSMNRSCW